MGTMHLGTGAIATVLILGVMAGCGSQGGSGAPAQASAGQAPAAQAPGQAARQLSGTIKADGSSTVFPITEAVAEEFQKRHPGVKVTVGVSGTSGGFKKFTAGETDISNASRPIAESEKKKAAENNIEYVELPVAYDALSVVVNPKNTFATCMTTAELKRIWEPNSKVRTWKDVRPEWPDQPIKLYGPGTDSGTFDYFTEEIMGKAKASRSDYVASEDDNVLVQGVAGDTYALGYFGLAYVVENQGKVKPVAVDGGKGCVAPSEKTVLDGTYTPLSRPIYIYVNKQALKRPEVAEFVRFYMAEGAKLAKQVGYVPLPDQKYKDGLARVEAALRQ